MAKKKTTKKAAKKKVTKNAPARKKAPVRKAASKKKVTKKATTTKKAASKKKVAKKKAVTKKAPASKKKATTKKATTKKAVTKKTTKKAASKKTTKKAPAKKTGASKPARVPFGVFDAGSMKESQKAAAKLAAAAGLSKFGVSTQEEITVVAPSKRLTKSPLTKKQLTEFKEILTLKRAEIVGDVDAMESEALSGGGSGSLSRLPQHMADQGSDTYDQSLALDLAASQRGLLREIDEALERIDAGTYGICEHTGGPIDLERLRAKPWARLSIEAARLQER